MAGSANVHSVDAIRAFHAAVLQFQEEGRLCLSAIEMQLLKIMGWLERDRPGFWKREIENCYREISEARVRLHQCQMRKMGDFKPTCFEEKKDLEKAKNDLEFAQKQIPVVKYWNVMAQHEANEYHGRSSQLGQMLEREIPQLLALLRMAVDRLEAYGRIEVPRSPASQLMFRRSDSAEDSKTEGDQPSDVKSASAAESADTSETDWTDQEERL
ncbi:MAG: hypothetical protein KDA81_07715 [Planctomycetaceae bacterium]|nr:hypothetical protein [Planctomycetaceae bacterium]